VAHNQAVLVASNGLGITYGVIYLCLHLATAVWIIWWARKHGLTKEGDPCFVTFLVLLPWPFSLIIWLNARKSFSGRKGTKRNDKGSPTKEEPPGAKETR
jgi:hypothetical protein